ncbi:MAG: LytTR family DNA-binding domain-containing protein [Cyclobacteriaceae bacterium]
MLAIFLLPFGAFWTMTSYAVDLATSRWISSLKNSVLINFLTWLGKIIILVNLIYLTREVLCDWNCVDLSEYFQIWIACILLFSFTYIPFALYGRYSYFHSLVGVGVEEHSEVKLKLYGEGKDVLTLGLNSIIYIQSDDNYVDMFLTDVKNPGRKLVLRCTLKSLEEQLKDYPQYVRIHRSVIINMRYVKEDGNRNSVSLICDDFKIQLPISKSYLERFEGLLVRPKLT